MPRTRAIVPPDTPGTMSAAPMRKPRTSCSTGRAGGTGSAPDRPSGSGVAPRGSARIAPRQPLAQGGEVVVGAGHPDREEGGPRLDERLADRVRVALDPHGPLDLTRVASDVRAVLVEHGAL